MKYSLSTTNSDIAFKKAMNDAPKEEDKKQLEGDAYFATGEKPAVKESAQEEPKAEK